MSIRMKRAVISLAVILIAMQTLGWAQGMKEKKRIFLFLGGGYAVSKITGGFAEAGVDIEVFPRVYLRGSADYYFKPDVKNNGGKSDYAYGLNLSAVYKIPLSDLSNFSLYAGGHYTTVQTTVDNGSVYLKVTESYMGIGGGFSFEYQLSNRIYFYIGGSAKYLNAPSPGTWFKGNGGFIFRVK